LQQIRINFEYLRPLISEARSAEKWKNRFLFWFKPTSGRTVNFEENYLVNKMINESVLTNIEIKRLQSSFIVALAKH
jgi:N-acetylneuraminic acid mutarotase